MPSVRDEAEKVLKNEKKTFIPISYIEEITGKRRAALLKALRKLEKNWKVVESANVFIAKYIQQRGGRLKRVWVKEKAFRWIDT